MGNRTSTARDEAAAAQSIGHFDHNYDAILIDQSSGMVEAPTSNTPVPAAVQRVLGDGRYVELVMKFDTVQLVEAQKVLLTIPYHGVKTLEWDHSCSSVKITANTAGEEAFCVVKVGNSLELENEAKAEVQGAYDSAGAEEDPDLDAIPEPEALNQLSEIGRAHV